MDAGELPFADVHELPVLFEPFIQWAGGEGSPSSSDAPRETLQPTLGEVLRLVFIHFAIEPNREDQDNRVDAEYADTYDDMRWLAEYDSETCEIESELESDRDEMARSEESGWYE